VQLILKHFRGITRFTQLLLHIVKGLLQLYWLLYRRGSSWHKTTDGLDTISAWMQQLIVIFNITVTRHGYPARSCVTQPSTLLLCNHISWLDIIIISSMTHVKFVSKDDLLYWPCIGKLAKNSGTLFLDRKNKFALRVMLKQVQASLENGLDVLIFPEGTTTNGKSVSTFRNGLIQAAINSHCQTQTVTLQYFRDGKYCALSPYINNDTFLAHAYRLLCETGTAVTVHFDIPRRASGRQRLDIARQAREKILDNIHNPFKSHASLLTTHNSKLDNREIIGQ